MKIKTEADRQVSIVFICTVYYCLLYILARYCPTFENTFTRILSFGFSLPVTPLCLKQRKAYPKKSNRIVWRYRIAFFLAPIPKFIKGF